MVLSRNNWTGVKSGPGGPTFACVSWTALAKSGPGTCLRLCSSSLDFSYRAESIMDSDDDASVSELNLVDAVVIYLTESRYSKGAQPCIDEPFVRKPRSLLLGIELCIS